MKEKFERPSIKKLNTGMPNKFGLKTEYEPITHIDDVPVKDLIDKYGSPVYVVSEKTIRKVYNDTKNAFTSRYPKVQFAWSYKTNYLNAVCNVYHQEGSWAEVVSGFEYEKAVRNGVKGEEIIFNGPDKKDEDIKKAIENKSLIHIDHTDELHSVIKIAAELGKKAQTAIRVNMDTGIHPQWSRFGFNYDNGEAWDALNRIMLNENLELKGLHAHIGTYIMTASAHGVAAKKMANLAVKIHEKYDHVIDYIDVGGGFASKNTLRGAYLPATDTNPSMDEFAESITKALINSEIKPDNLPTLIIEAGRTLIDEAGYILGSVIANKKLADGKHAMIVDVGVNLLFTSFWYEHKITPAQHFTQHSEDMKIYGPLCMNIDVIRENITFPVLKKGDNFVISRIGAYNMTQWLQFINLRPNILMIDTDKKVHVIRKAEKVENITGNEVVPEHLKDISK